MSDERVLEIKFLKNPDHWRELTVTETNQFLKKKSIFQSTAVNEYTLWEIAGMPRFIKEERILGKFYVNKRFDTWSLRILLKMPFWERFF